MPHVSTTQASKPGAIAVVVVVVPRKRLHIGTGTVWASPFLGNVRHIHKIQSLPGPRLYQSEHPRVAPAFSRATN
jgi:hypothetical protein